MDATLARSGRAVGDSQAWPAVRDRYAGGHAGIGTPLRDHGRPGDRGTRRAPGGGGFHGGPAMSRSAVRDVVVGGAQVLGTTIGAPVLRRRYNSWGATAAEVASPMPGDELVPNPRMGYTRAITIGAPPAVVWSWLVQIGQGRGGLYSFDGLENLARCDIHSTDRIQPELQGLAEGDLIRLGAPQGYPCFRVSGVQPAEFLVLVAADPQPPHAVATADSPGGVATWQWQLKPAAAGGHPSACPATADLPGHHEGDVAPGRAGQLRDGAPDAPRHQAACRGPDLSDSPASGPDSIRTWGAGALRSVPGTTGSSGWPPPRRGSRSPCSPWCRRPMLPPPP